MQNKCDGVSIRTVELERDQLLVIESGRWRHLKVIYGGLWLTSEGELQDCLPRAGESVVLEARGRSVAQAFGFARVELTGSIRRRPLKRVAETFRRAQRRLFGDRAAVNELAPPALLYQRTASTVARNT